MIQNCIPKLQIMIPKVRNGIHKLRNGFPVMQNDIPRVRNSIPVMQIGFHTIQTGIHAVHSTIRSYGTGCLILFAVFYLRHVPMEQMERSKAPAEHSTYEGKAFEECRSPLRPLKGEPRRR